MLFIVWSVYFTFTELKMDVDKKLGMSLDDLIKKTRPAKQAGGAKKAAHPNNKKQGGNTNKAVVGQKKKLGYVFDFLVFYI